MNNHRHAPLYYDQAELSSSGRFETNRDVKWSIYTWTSDKSSWVRDRSLCYWFTGPAYRSSLHTSIRLGVNSQLPSNTRLVRAFLSRESASPLAAIGAIIY